MVLQVLHCTQSAFTRTKVLKLAIRQNSALFNAHRVIGDDDVISFAHLFAVL